MLSTQLDRSADAIHEEELMYGASDVASEQLDEKYPHRPHNHGKTFPFHELFVSLFNPLNEIRKKPAGPPLVRRKLGRDGPHHVSATDRRRHVIERFISKWRSQVGNDIYPAFRLIVPEKDRERGMYGLKEKLIGKLLVKVMGISPSSADAHSLLNWKLPGLRAGAAAGDFGARCFEMLEKRPMRTTVGDMTVAEVNAALDKLSLCSKEEDQQPIFDNFYRNMNPEELMWLIRIILRQMKVGATEKTFFDIWHPDAESLFNVSSSLRRVCWELFDPKIRLESEQSTVTLMQCFQPQLAAFQMHSFEKMVSRMKATESDDVFWIEEKMDGERMQLHMIEDDDEPGGKRFSFWSRKAKDYTFLYGHGFEDLDSALTRHLKNAFDSRVRNIILDGEMITWNMEKDKIVPFGTLKTAALSEQRNPHAIGERPLYRIFDCLYVNDKPLTNYTLRDRRKALEASIHEVKRRFELHPYHEAREAADIEPALRRVVSDASEGLVLKNPRSPYRLSERNDDWIKVKPEYMLEFGEDLDCVIIGGYYGTGHRGGGLSSFLCGLRVDQDKIDAGTNPQKCLSFCKVGGGFTSNDYAKIKFRTENKWVKYNPKKPPSEFLELAGGDLQLEQPDVWIKPEDSLVIAIKAASVGSTERFKVGQTLRFPRFKGFREDKDWQSALSIQGFNDLRASAEKVKREREFEIDNERRKKKQLTKVAKKPLTIVGYDRGNKLRSAGRQSKLFEGLTFFVMSDSVTPEKKSKSELEQVIKSNGGKIVQSHKAGQDVVCVADRETLKARTIRNEANVSIVRPSWVFQCIKQAERDAGKARFLLPMEHRHMFFTTKEDSAMIDANVDEYGDSYCRDLSDEELKEVFENMPVPNLQESNSNSIFTQIEKIGVDFGDSPGSMFRGSTVYFAGLDTLSKPSRLNFSYAEQIIKFGGGKVTNNLDDKSISHVVGEFGDSDLKDIRTKIALRSPIPRIVSVGWVLESWKEKTRLDESRFRPD